MTKAPDFYRRRRWTVNGYFAYPLTAEDQDLPGFQKWLAFDALLKEAKTGDFSRIPDLAQLLVDADNWVLQGEYLELLGDAGSSDILNKILQNLPAGEDIVAEFAYGQLLEYWGHLSVIPVLVDIYERYSFSEDSMYIPPGLSRLMEKEPGDIHTFPMEGSSDDVKTYCQMVRRRYHELCERLGTDDAVVFRGSVIDVTDMCQRMLDDLAQKGRFHEELRHKLEAVTGIDCSGFYKNEVLQPLAAAATIEAFIDSPDITKYVRGLRYFFGVPLS